LFCRHARRYEARRVEELLALRQEPYHDREAAEQGIRQIVKENLDAQLV